MSSIATAPAAQVDDPGSAVWGDVTRDRIRTWPASSRATIVPVLDLGRDDAVDRHDPPEWMRETVILRDRHCVFPWCTRDARGCDLDHIVADVPLDRGGPPGQTSPSRLARLCRRHHRAKTHGGWGYQRARDGAFVWQGPHGDTCHVTVLGPSARQGPEPGYPHAGPQSRKPLHLLVLSSAGITAPGVRSPRRSGVDRDRGDHVVGLLRRSSRPPAMTFTPASMASWHTACAARGRRASPPRVGRPSRRWGT
jgi:hypothetical protein